MFVDGQPYRRRPDPNQSRARQMRFSSRTISWTAVYHRSGMKSRKICVCTTRAVAADAGRRESGERIDGRGSETERPRRAKRGRRSAAQRVEAAEEIGREVVPGACPARAGCGTTPRNGSHMSRLRNSWGWRLGAVLNSPGKHPFALDRRLDAGSGGPAARREVEVGLFRRVADRASEHRWVTDAGRAPRGVAGGALVMSPGVRAGRR